MRCQRCQALLPPGATVCPNCGTPVSADHGPANQTAPIDYGSGNATEPIDYERGNATEPVAYGPSAAPFEPAPVGESGGAASPLDDPSFGGPPMGAAQGGPTGPVGQPKGSPKRPKTLTMILVAAIALALGAGGGFGLSAFTAKSVSASFDRIKPVDDVYSISPKESVKVTLASSPNKLFIDKLTLTSSKPGVLQVVESDGNFEIKGVKTGKAEVTVSSKLRKVTKTYSFNVSVPPEELLNVPTDLMLDLDEVYELEPEVVPAESTYPVGYSSDDDSVVEADRDGKLTVKKAGTATVTVTCGEITQKIAIDAHRLVKSIGLADSEIELAPGESYQIEPTVEPDDAADKSVTYSSSDPTSAGVSSTGLVYAVWDDYDDYSATITVKSPEGPSATLQVTIVNPYRWDSTDARVAMPGTPYEVWPAEFSTAVPGCTGVAVQYYIASASSDSYLDQLKNASFDVYVLGATGGWEKVGSFPMEGSDIHTATVTFSERTVAQVAVVPATSFSADMTWGSRLSIKDVQFVDQPEGDGDT
ncbi:MAG: Ig-like domain-containing protein [Bifidobacteriaceae bacterium]|jgi:uncharacterized protein YjdB|nr:Ig-like domain-containing protein [Bifidobacteriaceae bacterium]